MRVREGDFAETLDLLYLIRIQLDCERFDDDALEVARDGDAVAIYGCRCEEKQG